MPFFREAGLIFVHIPKNAGRSIEKALLGSTGSPDGGRRTALNRAAHTLQYVTRSRFAEARLIGTLDVVLAAQHLTYGEMDFLGLLPSGSDGQPLPSFCVCRNPFDRAVSSVGHFKPGGHGGPSDPAAFERALAAFLERSPCDHNQRAHRRPQRHFTLDGTGRIAVDTVLRYETLGEDFARLAADHGLGEITLPWHGRARRARDYRNYYTESARRLVATAYGEDIEAFGYAF